jgi:hypothetical protein
VVRVAQHLERDVCADGERRLLRPLAGFGPVRVGAGQSLAVADQREEPVGFGVGVVRVRGGFGTPDTGAVALILRFDCAHRRGRRGTAFIPVASRLVHGPSSSRRPVDRRNERIRAACQHDVVGGVPDALDLDRTSDGAVLERDATTVGGEPLVERDQLVPAAMDVRPAGGGRSVGLKRGQVASTSPRRERALVLADDVGLMEVGVGLQQRQEVGRSVGL